MSGHTPGRWEAKRDSGSPSFSYEITTNNGRTGIGLIYCSTESGNPTVEDLANARLIAAAPAMLDALHKAFRALCELVPTNPAYLTEVAIVKDAITKAEDWP